MISRHHIYISLEPDMIDHKKMLSLLGKYRLAVVVGAITQPVTRKQFPVKTVDKYVNSTAFLISRLLTERGA
jgi:hypothetical protein